MCRENEIELYLPEIPYCTDNAVMIAKAAHIRLHEKRFSDFSIDVAPTLPIERVALLSRK